MLFSVFFVFFFFKLFWPPCSACGILAPNQGSNLSPLQGRCLDFTKEVSRRTHFSFRSIVILKSTANITSAPLHGLPLTAVFNVSRHPSSSRYFPITVLQVSLGRPFLHFVTSSVLFRKVRVLTRPT